MSSQITHTCENKNRRPIIVETLFECFGKQKEANTGNIKNNWRTNYRAHFGVNFQLALESTNFTTKF